MQNDDQRIEELLDELKAAAAHGPDAVLSWYEKLAIDDRQLFDLGMLARVQTFINQTLRLTFVIIDDRGRWWQRQDYIAMAYPYGISPAGFMLWCRHRKLDIAPVHSLDEADIYVSLDELMTGWHPLWEREGKF